MSRIIAGKMIVGDDELHFRDDDAQKKLKDLIVQGKGDSETAVMSQAAATEEFDKLSEEKANKNGLSGILKMMDFILFKSVLKNCLLLLEMVVLL